MTKHVKGTYLETAKRLRSALESKNMKAQELAERAGINKASISHYLSGSHQPSNVTATKMGLVLRVNPLWLMGFDVSPLDRVGSNVDDAFDSLNKSDLVKKAINESGLVSAELNDEEIVELLKHAEYLIFKRGQNG